MTTTTAEVQTRVPMVDYLSIDGEPTLIANECTACGARFFDRRSGCAACSNTEFVSVPVSRTGTVRTFTIVEFAAPGVEVPFVPVIVDCDGTSVRGNLRNVPPDPAHIELGMAVRLTTYPMGVDDDGVEAIGFGFEPDR